jgi:D-xylose transport system permease protein
MPTLHSSLHENTGTAQTSRDAIEQINPPVSFSRFSELQTWRMLGLVLAIAVMFVIFNFLTAGLFFTPRNLSNLSVQTSVTALLTVGMTWLMVARQIDLSGGALIALLGVLVAKSQVTLGWPLGATLTAALALGVLVGLAQGFIITRLAIPAFIATLAAFSYLRGAAFITSDGMTIAGLGDGFSTIANTNVPWALSIAAFVIAAAVVAVRKVVAWSKAENKGKLRPVDVVATVTFVLCALVGAWAFGSYRGIPSPVVAFLVVVGIASFVANNTAFGRHIYAIGASPEAARRAGINVKGMLIGLFVLSSVLATLGALIQTSRLDAGSPGTAEFLALDAISASVIGGTSLFGGRGTVAGSALGALLMSTIANGLSIMGTNTYWQLVTTGALLVAALTIDRVTNKGEQA